MSLQKQKIISKDDASQVQVWDLPTMDGPITAGIGRELSSPLTARDLQDIHDRAYQEGFELGRKEGRETGQREGTAAAQALFSERVDLFGRLLELMAEPVAKLDEEIEHSLADMTVMIAKQLVRRELRTAQGEIVAVVREAVGQLPVASRNPRIYLNPEDAAIVREALALGEEQDTYRLEEDPLITRGGCLIETASSFIDATVEARLNAIAARMFGGEREGERDA